MLKYNNKVKKNMSGMERETEIWGDSTLKPTSTIDNAQKDYIVIIFSWI